MSAPLTPSYIWRGARLFLTCLLPDRVAHANVQITNRCNMRCGFCSFPARAVGPKEELTAAQWRRVAKKLAKEGSLVVSIEGGEPTLRPDLPAIVRAFAEDHHPFVYTNGWLVTDRLAKELYRAGAVNVGVSLDYATPERHDRSRALAGAHERALAALRRLREAAPNGDKQVHVLTILMDDNLDELDELLTLTGSLGVRHMLSLLSTFGIYRSDRAQRPPAAGVSARVLELKRRHPHLRLFRSWVEGIDPFLEGRPPPCSAGVRALNLDHQALVSPCIEHAAAKAGDLLREPWPRVKRRLAALSEPRGCTRCWTLCRGTSESMAGSRSLGDARDFVLEFVR